MRRSQFIAGIGATSVLLPTIATAQPTKVAPPRGAFEMSQAAANAAIRRDRSDLSLARTALPRLYHHGAVTDDAVVLFHGFTNCPQQFDELARRFHERGCNVYVPRLPYHGNRDRLTRDLARLRVDDLRTCALDAYTIGRGLGRRVTALGLSVGGTLALQLAQTQPVDLAVAVAPFLMPIHVAHALGMFAMHALHALPDAYWWWDPRVKEHQLPTYAYPGYSTHALAECVFFGDTVTSAARTTAPAGKRSILVSNAGEAAVNNSVGDDLFAQWHARGAAAERVVLSDLGEPRHDIIDPTTFPQARTLVYPRLEALVLGGR